MPKIIIREIDNTTAGHIAYENFAVVVPGFCSKSSTVFDENGVYKCTSQSDFYNNVGAVAGATKTSAGKNAEPNNSGAQVLSAKDFYVTYAGLVYNVAQITKASEQTAGYLKYKDANGAWWKCSLATEWVADTYYLVIEKGNEGQDKIDIAYNGNQIAYELLGLGYTVLYKKIEGNDITKLDEPSFWECLKDKSLYDFRYICTGGYASLQAYKCINDIAQHNKAETIDNQISTGRGDVTALIDIDEANFNSSISNEENIKSYVSSLFTQGVCTEYSAICCPQVIYDETVRDEYNRNTTFPASLHYLACAAYARNELNYNEWYAIAGYTRGVCNKTIKGTTLKLGEIAVNALQPRTLTENGIKASVNLIIDIHGSYYFWGSRTACKLDEKGLKASHFLTIRQLCTTLKKQLYVICRQLTFDPNSDILWGKFCNAIKPTLEKMKSDQGIQDYRIIKVKSARKALLTVKIRIVPIEPVEDFDISVYLEDSVSGNTITVETEE